ncbi:MAG: S9 family peptidase, partial [Acidimicrobiales bacterium]|nr:S9 family peptidase [Acidimicrobiales bacterium]
MQSLPPQPKRIPHELKLHGDVRIDDYYWINNREDPDVLELLRAENEYFDSMTSHLVGLKDTIYSEILERIVQDERSLPVLKGSYSYSTLMREGMSYPIHTRRKKDSPGALDLTDPMAPPANDEEVIIDQNVEALGHDYFSLGGIEISPSEDLAAVLFDYEGDEVYTLKIKSIGANTYLSDEIEEVSTSMAWSKDCKYIFYTKLDAAMRPFELWRHEIGAEVSQDQLIYREDDEAFFLSISTTKDDTWLLLELNSKISSEIRVLKSGEPASAWTLIEKRHEDFEYHIDHIAIGDISYFLVLTNHNALNFKLCLAPCDQPSLENWVDLTEYDPSIRTEDFEVFRDYVVLSQRKDATKRLLVIDVNSKKERVIESNQSVGVVSPTGNADIGLDFIRYRVETLNRPEAIFDEKLDGSKPPELRFERPVKNINTDKFVSTRLFATSEDGTQIPISLIESKDASIGARQSRPLV